MGSGRRWLLLGAVAALLSFAAALWMLGRVGAQRRGRGGVEELRGSPREAGAVAGGVLPSGAIDPARSGGRASVSEAVGEVFGRVVDLDGVAVEEGRLIVRCVGEPLSNGTAIALGPEGEFRGPGCRGEACVELVHMSLIPRTAWVLRAEEAALLVARPLEVVEGVVVDPEGAPVVGARVWVRPPPGEQDPRALPPFTQGSAISDEEGKFRFSRVARPPCDPCAEARGRCSGSEEQEATSFFGEIALVVRARGFRSAEVVLEVDEAKVWRVVMTAPVAAISGRLADAEGRAYARGRIIARSRERSYEVHQALADETGAFVLEDLGDGAYEVRAIQDGVELARDDEVMGGAKLSLAGPDAAGVTVNVRIMSETQRPVAGVSVDGGPFGGALTDAAGWVQATRVLPGPYSLQIAPPGRGPLRQPLMVTAGEAEMTLMVALPAAKARPLAAP